MFRQEPVLIDEHPLVDPVLPANAAVPAHIPDRTSARLWSSALLLLVALVMWWGWRGSRFSPRIADRVSSRGIDRASGPEGAATTSGGLS
jgi:hypothetical protein